MQPLGVGSGWVGLWESEENFLKIFQNGYGLYNRSTLTAIETYMSADGTMHSVEVFMARPVYIENNILTLKKPKESTYETEEFVFNIDEEPTESIDDAGNPYTYIVLDGETLIKTE